MGRWVMVVLMAWVMASFLFQGVATCEGMSNKEIMQELEALRKRISELEKELTKKDQKIEEIRNETVKREEMPGVIEKMRAEGGPLSFLQEHIQFSGLIEVGGVWANTDKKAGGRISESDVTLNTAQLAVQANLNDWINGGIILKYEDPTFAAGVDESGIRLDVGIVTIGNPRKFPLFITAGAMYVPFGGLLTHLPDNPLIDQPLTLVLGESREKAALFGFEYEGLRLSGYAFNGDMNKKGHENRIESFGFDANYSFQHKTGFQGKIGASYISNIADSNGLTEVLNAKGITEIESYIGGFDGYLSLSYSNFFLDGEIMTALKAFAPDEISTWQGKGARPMVWNVEAGYNYNWGKNLEIVLKYAGSNQAENIGYPRRRYGIGFNQTIFDGVIGSLGYFHDRFDRHDKDGRDSRDMIFGQIAVEF